MNGPPACRRTPHFACALLALAVVASHACAQQTVDKAVELKLSTAVGPAFALGGAGERWAKLIVEASAGKLAVKVHSGASLAGRDPAREFAALAIGDADLAVGSSLFWSTQVGELNVIGLPWLVPDAKALEALIVGAMKERLDAAIERAGAVPLAYAPLGPRALATTKVPVRTPDDMAGMRVRIASAPLVADLFFALRASPRSMTFAEAQTSMRAGTIDAQEGAPATMASSRIDALGMRHVVLWGAIAEVAVFAVNGAAWAALTEPQRTLVSEAAIEAARELRERDRAEIDAALAELGKRGVAVTRLTATGRATFAFAARSAYDKWAGFAGAELARAAEAAIAGTR
ncbi:MAG: TRAP transporter substrate-binding protein DctP [Betaproteobacteria bacterium]